LIRFRHPGTDRLQQWRLASEPLPETARSGAAIICTNMEAVRMAAVAGLGIAWAPDFLVADALGCGELAVTLEDERTEGSFWLLWPGGRQESNRLRALIDFATSRLFGND
jgi:DNA-binding transcriptional LysR family regulator